MKFLLEFVSCCGAPRQRMAEPEEAPLDEEESSLVAVAPSRISRRRKRGRPGSSGSSSLCTADWRPSLTSISEDNVAMVANRTAGVERAVKRKSSQDRTRVRVPSHSDDYGRASFTTAIPAFSPTPFMF